MQNEKLDNNANNSNLLQSITIGDSVSDKFRRNQAHSFKLQAAEREQTATLSFEREAALPTVPLALVYLIDVVISLNFLQIDLELGIQN